MEPRAAIAYQDSLDGRYTLCTSCQEPHEVKHTVAHLLGISELNLRVVAMDVGGAFGMKGQVYPEEVLVLWAARKLGRPVKWTADRSESLASDMHGRGPIAEAELSGLQVERCSFTWRSPARKPEGRVLGGAPSVSR